MFATSSQIKNQYEMFCINGVLTKIFQNTQPTTQSTTYLGDLGKGSQFTGFLPKNNQNNKIQKNNQNNKIQKNNQQNELDKDQFQKQFNKMIKSKQDYNKIYKFYLENKKFDTRFEYKMDFIQYLTKCDNVSNDTIKNFLNDKCSSIEWKQFKQEILNCLIDSEQEQAPEIIEIDSDSDYKPEIEEDIEEEFESDSEEEIEEEETPKDYCNICNDILLTHIYGNVCKKHIPSYALHDLEMYDELTLKELDVLPSSNKIDRSLLKESYKFFQESRTGMSMNEKTLVFITLFKNGCSFYLNDKIHIQLKNVILAKCNEIIYDKVFLKNVPKQIQNKLISYVKKIKKML